MPSRPNILWLMSDEQRCDSLGYHGAPWACSPHLDALACGGVRFHAAYTPSPVCVPARACLLCARPASSIGVYNNHHRLCAGDPRFLTWTFARSGYQTASFGKSHYNGRRRAFDAEGGCVLGDRVGYYGYKIPVDETAAGTVYYTGGKSPWMFAGRFPGSIDETPEMENVRQALAWLDGRDPKRPFFLRVSFNAPHTPVCPPAPFDTLIDPEAIDLPVDDPETMAWRSETERGFLHDYAGTHRLTRAQIHRARQAYYGHCAFVDHCFGALIAAVRERGDLDHTLVAFASDHGTHLGDGGFFQKQSFYEPAVRVPFFLAGPGVPEKAAVETPVHTGSLLPTLLDLAGLDIPDHASYPSLVPLLHGRASDPGPVFSEIDYGLRHYRPGDRCVMVRHGRYKLVRYRDPIDKERIPIEQADIALFDLSADPHERTNLAGDPAYARILSGLTDLIDGWDRGRPICRGRQRSDRMAARSSSPSAG